MATTNASIHWMDVEVEGDVDVMDDWNNCWNQFVLWCWVVEDDDAIRNHSSALARKKFHASATILGGTTIIWS